MDEAVFEKAAASIDRMAAKLDELDSKGRPREYHDYGAMLAELQAHPSEHRIVWRRPLPESEAARKNLQSLTSAIASALRGRIASPHVGGVRGQIRLCRKLGCEPWCKGYGTATSRKDVVTSEMQVIGIWLGEDTNPSTGRVKVPGWEWTRLPGTDVEVLAEDGVTLAFRKIEVV